MHTQSTARYCLSLCGVLERLKSGSQGQETTIASFQAFLYRLHHSAEGKGLPDAARTLPKCLPFKMLPSFIFWETKNHNLH